MSRSTLRIAAIILTASTAMAALQAQGQDAAPTRQDVLLIERLRAASDVALPVRGERMAAVRARFGEPNRTLAPVGNGAPQRPPITRWVYPQFTVYFEHDHVVNAVLNKASPQEIGPKPVR